LNLPAAGNRESVEWRFDRPRPTTESGAGGMTSSVSISEMPQYFTEEEIANTVAAVADGGLVLVKGDIGYGLLGNSERAIRNMYEAKGRPYSNPCIVIGNMEILEDVALIPNQVIREWIRATAAWTTLAVVLPLNPRSRLIAGLTPWVYERTVTNNTIAIFLNVGPFLEEVIVRASRQDLLIVGSSANPSSQGNIYQFSEIPEHLREVADFSIDHGKSKYANVERKATTIVNFTNWSVKRRGVNWERIEPGFLALQNKS
jgi:tRNA A37 threonylcarbamoyladenosine synthetase subunit TsaC/SUA5/YrdC